MICQRCGKYEATIHLTEIVDSQMMEVHICEHCAKEKGADLTPIVSFTDLLSGLVDFTTQPEGVKDEAIVCPDCRMTWEQFKNSGRLGCSDCYEAFQKFLMPLIQKVQGSTHHMGKRPSRLSGGVRIEMEIRNLNERLKQHIDREEYEEAAQVRDKVKVLEGKLETKETEESK